MLLPFRMTDRQEKDRSEPYPCMDRPCGCASAQQCWKKCCCFTNQQKIAWAKRAGVKVPEFVAQAAAVESSRTNIAVRPRCSRCTSTQQIDGKLSRAITRRKGEVCGPSPKSDSCRPSVSNSPVVKNAESASAETDRNVRTTAEQREVRSARSGSRYLCGISALECQGLTSLWQILSMTLLSESDAPKVCGTGLSTGVPTYDPVICSCEWPPPEPPPRI
jgi:hypothetical protein